MRRSGGGGATHWARVASFCPFAAESTPRERPGRPHREADRVPGHHGEGGQSQVKELATTCGWKAYHTFDSRRSASSFPDLVLVRDRVVFLDLKQEQGTVSDAQREWGHALLAGGAEFFVRPRHLDTIGAVLAHRGRPATGDRGDVDQLVTDTLAELRRKAAA
jgi:hypothetical protein